MRRLVAALVVMSTIVSARAENWPAWRGPTGQGHSSEKNLPVEWSPKKNVKWKIDLADQGNSTPVVWGDKIFLTQANKGGSVRSLMCFARADGKQLWKVDVDFKGKERNWNQSWYGNASPVVDGERVVVSFGSAGVWCYDFDGKELWNRTDLGEWQHGFGNGASPIFYENTVIQWCGPNENKGRNFLLAMDRKTGSTVWEKDESNGSWSTPLIVKVDGKDQMLLGFSPDAKSAKETPKSHFKGYDPKTGKELWDCSGLNSYVYTSPLVKDGIAVQMSGYQGAAIAVKLGGEGDITKDRLWRHPTNPQRVGSGVIVGDHVYQYEDDGQARCFELKTGREVWKLKGRVGAGSWGSMVHADGKLYALSHDGDTLVFAASPEYQLLATNRLGEPSNSSIAISDGNIFVRTFKKLWCIHAEK
jgi:outer membrane protein assembly factor BamB